jgi:Cu/Ag efflux protein CusF
MLKLKTPHEWARDKTPEQWADHHMKVVIILIALAVFVSYPVGVFVLDAAMAARHAKAASASPAAQSVDGSGVVLSSNDSTGTITIQHSGVPRLGLAPGATMFHASPEIIKRTAVGDQVIFRLAKGGDAYVVTALQIPAFKDRTDPDL